jgi:hypothetical protein
VSNCTTHNTNTNTNTNSICICICISNTVRRFILVPPLSQRPSRCLILWCSTPQRLAQLQVSISSVSLTSFNISLSSSRYKAKKSCNRLLRSLRPCQVPLQLLDSSPQNLILPLDRLELRFMLSSFLIPSRSSSRAKTGTARVG